MVATVVMVAAAGRWCRLNACGQRARRFRERMLAGQLGLGRQSRTGSAL
jgi:hypothetical protein